MSFATTCPHCAAPGDLSGGCANCTGRASSSRELVAKAEALFVSYLAARIVHARQRLKEVQRELRADPRNRQRLDAVTRTEDEIARLQAQLVAQTREAQRIQHALDEERRSGRHQLNESANAVERKCPRCDGIMPGVVNHCRCGYVVESTTATTASLLAKEPGAFGKAGKGK